MSLSPVPKTVVPASPIQHVVFIIQENHSFDNYFATFPGANGLLAPKAFHISADTPVFIKGDELPPDIAEPDQPLTCSQCFALNAEDTADMAHAWTHFHVAWDSGKMDKFFEAERTN